MTRPTTIVALLAAGTVLAEAGSAAAAVADRVVAEVPGGSSVAVRGSSLAWQVAGPGGAAAVLAPGGSRTVQRFDAGRVGGEVTLGEDARGRRTLVFTRCERPGRCTLRQVDVRSGRQGVVAGVRGAIAEVALRRGRLAWIAGSRVLVRALTGGRTRRQFVGRGIEPDGLDHDGRRLVVTGSVAPRAGNGAFAVRLVAIGGSRVRFSWRREYGEQYRTVRDPILERDGVVVSASISNTGANDLTRISFARGRRRQVPVGAYFTALARDGARTAYVLAPGEGGCASGASGEPGFETPGAPASCRIVRAGADPVGGRERITPPELSLVRRPVPAGGGVEVGGRLVTRTVRRGRVVARTGLAGAEVELQVAPASGREADLTAPLVFPPTGPRVVTDAAGRFALGLAPDPAERVVRALTVATPRAWSGDVLTILQR